MRCDPFSVLLSPFPFPAVHFLFFISFAFKKNLLGRRVSLDRSRATHPPSPSPPPHAPGPSTPASPAHVSAFALPPRSYRVQRKAALEDRATLARRIEAAEHSFLLQGDVKKRFAVKAQFAQMLRGASPDDAMALLCDVGLKVSTAEAYAAHMRGAALKVGVADDEVPAQHTPQERRSSLGTLPPVKAGRTRSRRGKR